MRLNLLAPRLSFLALIILLPVRHLLSYFQGLEALPVIRGLGLLPLFFSLILVLLFLKSRKCPISWYGWLIFVFLLTLSGSIVFFSPNLQDYLGRSSFMFNASILAYYFIYFCIGFYYNGFEQYRKWVFFFWFLMFLNLLCHYDFSAMRISFREFDPDKVSIYLFLGDSFAIWSLLVLSLLTEAPFKSTCVAICSVFALLAFNSRTSLYSFVLVIPLVIILTKKSLKYWIISLILFFMAYSTIFEILEYSNKRMLAFLYLRSDSSMIARIYLLKEGFEDIRKNWFLGDYAGQLRYGSLGSYIHNYLSLWRQFGLVPFLAFLSLLFIFIMKCWKMFWINIHRRKISPREFFLIVAGSFCIIEIVAARSYVAPYIWFFLGASLNSGIYVYDKVKKKSSKKMDRILRRGKSAGDSNGL